MLLTMKKGERRMANSTGNVSVGKPKIGGAIHYAPVGTELPNSVTAELDTAFSAMGYISDDGVTNSSNIESEKIKAWGGDVVLAIQTGKEDTFQFALIESLNENVLKAVHNAENVSGSLSTGITIKVNGTEQSQAAWVIDMIMTNGILKRIVIPKGQISEIGDVVYKEDTPVSYEITLTCLPDENENTHYEYIQNPKSSGEGGGGEGE